MTNTSVQTVKLGEAEWQGRHILTVAEAGFSMLTIYGNHRLGLPLDEIDAFANVVNRNNRFQTLHPRIPLSAVPNRYFREYESFQTEEVLQDFENDLLTFIEANERDIRATSVLVDFHVYSAPVPKAYIRAVLEVFQRESAASLIQDLVVLS